MPPISSQKRCWRAPGGSKQSVRAKIRQTINTSTSTNPPTGPLLVRSEAVRVAISIITTAPGGHDCENRQYKEQSVGFGPDLPGDDYYGHKEQRPEHRVVTDFFQ